MKNDRIILEGAFRGNAKFYLYLIYAITFLPLVVTLPQIMFLDSFSQDGSSNMTIWIWVIAIITLLAFAIIIFPLKKGLYINNSDLFFGYFSWGKLLYKHKIDVDQAKAVSVLKFKRRQRGAYMSLANPEFSTTFNSFEVYVLNERHTKRSLLISLKKENNAKKALEFVVENTEMSQEIYSPDFS